MQDYTLNFTMNESTDNNANFLFFMGGNTVSTYIDNASLTKANCDTPPPPSSGECDCPDPAEPGNTVTVSNASQLRNAINQANSQGGNMTIKVEPGVYQVDYTLVVSQNTSNLTIMGTTGNRDDVFIKGQGYNGSVNAVLLVQADNFTIADMTVGESSTHAIQLQGELDADNFTAINVRFVDVYQQMLKVSTVDDDEVMDSDIFSDNGRVLCCEFEFTAGQAYNDYTRGIDALKCKNWVVSHSVFKNIRVDYEEEVEPAILFWKSSHGTTVTNNRIMNCDRGIGFGLAAPDKLHHGHTGGGLIANNFVHTNKDVGIGLQHAPNVKVYNNTVITDNYSNSIEYRYPATANARIFNNLVSGNVARQVDAPLAITDDNYRVSDLSIFADATNHDYHLVGTPSGIVDAGTPLNEVTTDIDCDNRISGVGMDIGADEVTGSAKEDVSLASSFILSPNPANHSIQLTYELSENTQADIHVYDAFGKLVKHMTDVELITGSTIDVEVAQLPAGVYFCALQFGESQAVKKFIIAR